MVGWAGAIKKDILVGFVVPEFDSRDQRRYRLELQRRGDFPQRLGHRCGSRGIRSPCARIRAARVVPRAGTDTRSPRILENLPAEPGTPLFVEIVDQVAGQA